MREREDFSLAVGHSLSTSTAGDHNLLQSRPLTQGQKLINNHNNDDNDFFRSLFNRPDFLDFKSGPWV